MTDDRTTDELHIRLTELAREIRHLNEMLRQKRAAYDAVDRELCRRASKKWRELAQLRRWNRMVQA